VASDSGVEIVGSAMAPVNQADGAVHQRLVRMRVRAQRLDGLRSRGARGWIALATNQRVTAAGCRGAWGAGLAPP
jgi:hypothetical protein